MNSNSFFLKQKNIYLKIVIYFCIYYLFFSMSAFCFAQSFTRVNNAFNGAYSVYSIKVDANGNIYHFGVYQSITLGSGSNSVSFYSSLGRDYYISKYDQNQNLIWAKHTVGDAFVNLIQSGMNIDASGNVYITGSIANGQKTFGYGEANAITLTSSSFNAGIFFVAKYNTSNGELTWLKSATALNGGNPDMITGQDLALDNSGNCYVTGYFEGTATFGSLSPITSYTTNNYDGFLIKYDQSNGTEIWLRHGPTGPLNNFPNAIDVDGNGNIYYTGTFAGSAVITGIWVSVQLTTTAEADVFIAKFNDVGELFWGIQSLSTGSIGRFNPSTLSDDIVVDNSGNSFITGIIQAQSVYFGQLSTQFGCTVPTFYIAKIDGSGNFSWVNQANFISGSSSNCGGNYISITTDGTPVTTGNFSGAFSINNVSFSSVSTSGDYFIASFNNDNGGLICLNQPHVFQSSAQAALGTLCIDNNNNIYTVGQYTGISKYGAISVSSSSQQAIITLSKECCVDPVLIQNTQYNDQYSFFGVEAGADIFAGYDVGGPSPYGDVIVQANNNVTYQASNSIHLTPGFKAVSGCSFHALISECDANLNYGNDRLSSNNAFQDNSKLVNRYNVNNNPFLKNESVNSKVNVYPNPSSGVFNILTENFNLDKDITITNFLGISVLQETIVEDNFQINLSDFSKGIYFITIFDNKNTTTRKLIVQ